MQPMPRNRPAPLDLNTRFLQPQTATLLMLLTVALVSGAFWFSPLLAIALVFAGVCIFLAQKYAAVFVCIAFLFFPFQQSMTGENSSGNISVSDAFLLIAFSSLPLLSLSRRRLAVGPAGVPLILFLSLSIVSSAFHWEGLPTAVSLARMWVATLLPVLFFANVNDVSAFAHRCFQLFLIGINVLSLGSLLSFAQGGVNASMNAMGNNKNLLGPMLGCGIVIALIYLFTEQSGGRRRLWLILTVLGASAGCLLSLSRGGWIATAGSLMLMFLLLRQIKVFIISLFVLVPVLFFVWRLLPEKATSYASDVSTNAHTVQTRFEVMNQVMASYEESPLIGVGVGLRKKMEPHNVLILTLGEEGILGLCGFVSMFIGGFATFWVAWKETRSDPQALQLVIIGACLLLLSLTAGLMDVYWRRGPGFLGWAGVGIAANIIEQGRRGRLSEQTPASPGRITPAGAARGGAKTP